MDIYALRRIQRWLMLLSAIKIVDSQLQEIASNGIIDSENEDGSAGSGNWGHAGRPGIVGGSAGKGYNQAEPSKSTRTTEKGTGKGSMGGHSGKDYRLEKPAGNDRNPYTGYVWAVRANKAYDIAKQSGMSDDEARKVVADYMHVTPQTMSQKVEPKEPPKTTVEKPTLTTDNLPKAFQKPSERKSEQALDDYINNKADADPTTVSILSHMGDVVNDVMPDMEVGHGANSKFVAWKRMSTNTLAKAKLVIPKLGKNVNVGDVTTTIHERMHMFDMLVGTRLFGRAMRDSDEAKNLRESVMNARHNPKIGDAARNLFERFNSQIKSSQDEIRDNCHKAEQTIISKYFPTGYPTLPNGKPDFKSFSLSDKKAWNAYVGEYNKEVNTANKAINAAGRDIMGGGIDSLQDLYSAVHGGSDAGGLLRFGHSIGYYQYNDNRVAEMIANWGAIGVVNPQLREVFRGDYPDVAKGLDDIYTSMNNAITKTYGGHG